MNVSDLIKALEKLPPNAPVKAFDWSTECYEDVTGLIWNNDGSDILIETDNR